MIASKKPLIAAGSLVILIVATALLTLQFRKQRRNTITQDSFEQKYQSAVTSLHNSADKLQARFEHNNRSETSARPGYVEQTASALTLSIQGIAWNLRQPLVMLNNTVYTTGDSIDGFRIEKILPDRIIVKDTTGERKQIKLREEPL